MWDFAAFFTALMEPVAILCRFLEENYVMVEEHHHQLQWARRAHSADLVLICTALDEEVHEALVQKRQELGEARGALNRASRVLAKRHPN